MPGARAVVYALALLATLACTGEAEPPEVPARFDGERAFRDLVDLVAIGPRPAGSEGAARARGLIRDRLRQAGFRVEPRPFVAQTPAGEPFEMVNLVGVLDGARPEVVMWITHYDTKRLPGVRFVGANDGASGVAVLLELARQLGRRPPRHTVWLVFCDGEEAFGREMTPEDGLYGSRALSEELEQEGSLERIRALVLVDMVADRDLHLTEDVGSSPRLRRMLRESAQARGLTDALEGGGATLVIDDHSPFAERGVEDVLALIDFQFGGGRIPGTLWHTGGDDLEAVSAESLNTTGSLAVELHERIDAFQ